MTDFQTQLDWIAGRRGAMLDVLCEWVRTNSWSRNPIGLSRVAAQVTDTAHELGFSVRQQPLPAWQYIDERAASCRFQTADALLMESAAVEPAMPSVLLSIHFDTVFPPEHPFREPALSEAGDILRGPGALDAKAGIVILLTGLAAFLRSDVGNRLRWQVVLNPDEEIGSPCSGEMLKSLAARHDIGLVFEPALPGPLMAGSRRGLINHTLIVTGKSAHAGRDFHAGRNAAVHMARLICLLDGVNRLVPGVTLNVGPVHVDSAVNIVPDLAVSRFNLRFDTDSERDAALREVHSILQWSSQSEGFHAQLHTDNAVAAKPLTPEVQKLLDLTSEISSSMGQPLTWTHTGGVSDGNRLAEAGLPVVDTLGAIGAGLHTDAEHLHTDSLVQRAQLLLLLLGRIANDPSSIPMKPRPQETTP